MAEEEKIMMIVEEEQEMSTTTTTVLLPQDILMDIFSRFPVETLLNSFKFVCKAWRTLIQDPYFVNMHLNRRGGGGGGGGGGVSINGGRRRILNDNSNSSLYCKSGNKLYQLHYPFNYDDGTVLPPIPIAEELDYDLASSVSQLVGSCNGLICIRDFRDDQRKNYIIILNPSTRKYKVLPEEPKLESHSAFDRVTYGFGCCCHYNTNNDYEYKLVRIAYLYPVLFINRANFKLQIDIYSISSNSWKRRKGIKDFPALLSRYRPTIFLNGALHWTGFNAFGPDLRDELISFDLRDEDYRPIEMPPPSCVIVDKLGDTVLINMRGCLGIIFISRCSDFDIWVMKEYGIRESWTRECVIKSSNTNPPGALPRFQTTWKSAAYFLKGDQILIHIGYGRMALCNMKSKKIERNFNMVGVAGVNHTASILHLADYIETLVSPKSSHAAS